MADLYDLSDRELQMARLEIERRQKSAVVAWLLWLFLGGLGGHRYYLGPVWQGILMTVTLGGLGFWALIDAFFIPRRLQAVNKAVEDQVVQEILARRGRAGDPPVASPAG